MIVAPPAWTSQRRDGALLMLSPDGAMAISYREALRPVVAIEVALARVLAEIPADIEHVGPIAPFLTHEGEHAAMVIVTANGSRHAIGFVFVDDYYACLHGAIRDHDRVGELAKQLYELVLSDAHMLGVRRRRYRYAPPPGWTAESSSFETTWRKDGASITVNPAWPASVDARELVGYQPTEPIVARDHLAGWVFDLVVRGAQRTFAVLQDARYVYSLRLDPATPKLRAIFLDVVRSIVPHPGASLRAEVAASLFAYAAD